MSATAARLSRAAAKHEQGDLPEAERLCRQVIQREPKHGHALSLLGVICNQTGRPDQAAHYLRKAVQTQPNDAASHHNLADALRALGELDEAIVQYRAVARLRPEIAAVWCNLGAALRAAGRAGESIEALEQARALDPALIEAHTNLVSAFVELKDVPRALAASRRAMSIDPRNALVQWSAAAALLPAGELEMAAEHLRAAIRLDPTSPLLHRELGDVLRRLERFEEAETAYEQALRIDPDSVDALIGRMKGRSQTGRKAEALQMAQAIAQRFPLDAAAVHAVAGEYMKNDRHAEAAALIEQRLGKPGVGADDRRILLFALGEALDRLGRYEDAWHACEQANRLKGERLDRAALDGQIDSIIAAFDRHRMAIMPRAEAGPVRIVFIVGMPRSGSTLFEQILSSHPQVAGGGEMNLMGRIVGRIETLTGVSEPYPQCAKRLEANALRRLADFAYGELAKIAAGRRCVTEKTPDNFRFLGLIEQLFPEARIIICRRDPRDLGLSCYFHDFTGNHPYACDLADLGYFVRQHERLLQHWRATLSLPMLDACYEDLVDHQEPVMRRLLEFCRLPWDDRCLAFHENRRIVHTASAEQVRRRIYGSSVGRYRNYEQHLAPLIEALKQEDDDAPPAGDAAAI